MSQFFIGLVATFVATTALALAVTALAVSLFTGWDPVALTSGSMSPALRTGDIVIAQPSDGLGLGPRTIVVFEDPAQPGRVTHRVVAVNPDATYTTKGDANARLDSTPLHPSGVIGVARVVVPYVGIPLVWWSSGAWLKFTAFALVALLTLWMSRWGLLERFDPWLNGAPRKVTFSERPAWVRRALRTSSAERLAQALSGGRTVVLVGVVLTPMLLWGAVEPGSAGFADSNANGSNSIIAAASFTDELTLYLQNVPTPPVGDTASHSVLPLGTQSPTAATLFNYDTDRDSTTGLLIGSMGTHNGSTINPTTEQNWDFPVATSTPLLGVTSFTFWTAAPGFITMDKGRISAALYVCNDSGSKCDLVASNEITLSPIAPSGTWTEYTIGFGTLKYSAPVSSIVRLEVIAADSTGTGLIFAYDTMGYPTRLHFGG